MKIETTICAAAVKNEFELLIRAGANPSEIEKASSVKLADLTDPDEQIPMQKYIRLEQAAPKLTGNPAIGLSMGMDAPPTESQTGILGYIAAHSPTVREGFRQAIRFSNLLSNAQIMELREMDDQAEFVYMRTDPMYFTIQGIELALSRTATTLKMLGGDGFQFWSAHFQYPAPQYISEYRQIFGNELWFEERENKVVFSSDILSQKTPGAQPYLKDVLLTRAEELLAGLNGEAEIKQQIQKEIINSLPSGSVSIDKIATDFGFSRQTLYRRLKEEGTSFQQLLEDTRKNLAASYLRHTEYSISEVAFLLGFSELSSFHRAFKRWYGHNPQQYRASIVS